MSHSLYDYNAFKVCGYAIAKAKSATSCSSNFWIEYRFLIFHYPYDSIGWVRPSMKSIHVSVSSNVIVGVMVWVCPVDCLRLSVAVFECVSV